MTQYPVDRFDASAIMFSLEGIEPKPSGNGSWVRASDYDALAARAAALEKLRPHWAQGFTNDSMAAQVMTSALSQIWGVLGVENQTDAIQKLRELMK